MKKNSWHLCWIWVFHFIRPKTGENLSQNLVQKSIQHKNRLRMRLRPVLSVQTGPIGPFPAFPPPDPLRRPHLKAARPCSTSTHCLRFKSGRSPCYRCVPSQPPNPVIVIGRCFILCLTSTPQRIHFLIPRNLDPLSILRVPLCTHFCFPCLKQYAYVSLVPPWWGGPTPVAFRRGVGVWHDVGVGVSFNIHFYLASHTIVVSALTRVLRIE